jgi:hypothetical protein
MKVCSCVKISGSFRLVIAESKVAKKTYLNRQAFVIFCYIKVDRYSDKYSVLPKYTALIGLLKVIIFIIFVDIVDC